MPDLGGGGGADADDNPVQQKAATAQGLVGWDAYSPRSVEHLPPPLRSGASRLAPPPLASDASDDAGDVSTDSGLHTVDACPPHEAAVVEAYNVTKPLADRLWPVLADKDLADGWTGLSVALLASCLDSDGASMGVESLSAWWTGLSRRRDDLRLSMARTLRSITQTEGFGRAVLSDAARSEHQRLLKLCLGFVRESKRVLEDPSCVSNYPLCLEVVQLVASLAAATAGDVRYDPKRWLRPLMVPASLQNSWPIVERCSLLELLMRWVRWREDKALAALATGGVRPQTQRSTPAVGSLEEQALFRIETVSAHAILLLVQSGPVMERDRLLAIAEAGPWSRDLDLLGWYESTHAEEGHNTLACLLGHHFEHLLPAFLHRAYFFAGSSPRLSTRYFHAIVDALVPADAALDDGPAAASDRDFESEVEAASPSLMLFGMIHLASTDARTRSRAFDLICRLTDSFGPAEGFECDGSSLGARRLLYAADEPTPMLLSSHLEKMRLAVAAQCPALSLPLVRGGVALLTQTQPLALTGAQQLLVLRTLSPWLANLQLEPLPSSRLSESSTFQFLREIAIVGLQPWSASGEAGDAYGALWHQLSARPADRSTAGQPAAPSNAYVIASFMLQVASRSDKAATLVRRLAVIAFDASPAELLPMLLARIEGEPLEESPPPTTQPCAPGPGGLIESVVEGASGADQAEDPIMAAVVALSGKPSRVQPRTLRFASAAAATEAESAPAVPGGLPEENEAVPAPEEEEGEEELLASTEQLRAAALLMLIEPLRHSMQRPLAQSAVCGEMPRILNLALLLMHSQSESALSVEENRSLRQLLRAMLESIVEAHRQSAGLAHLPVGVTTNQLPREVLALTERLGLASFRLRWPRVPNEVNNATPSIAMAMEAVNCCPIKEALCGILACVEGLGRTEVAAEWFSLAINRLRQPMELADRFKELSLVRLLLPLQPEHVRVTGLFHLVLESAQTALLELEGAAAARQRKSLPLALAEEAGALLGDIAARLAARGQLVQQPLLPWALVALTASPHPSIHATVYPALCFCLDHEPLLVAMRAGTLLPPPPRADSGGGDAFAGGLLAALLRNVCAAGCWGGAAASGLPVAHNGPAVAEAARGAALQSLRLASSVQAALVLSSPKREVAEMLAGVAAPLLDCWVIQLCELHALLSGASADTFATRAAALAAFEGLSDAAVAVDSLRGDTGPTTTTAALVAVASGDFALGDGDAAIRSLATPLLKAFLPTAGPHLARFARRLLASGPKHYAAPVLLLCTVALRTPGADCVAAFKPIVQGVAGLSLPAVPDLLLAAAMAGTRPTRLEAVITTAQCEGRDTALAAGAADTGAETRGASGALHALEQVLARA
ncbi:hypothetical protein EMIHUDRAFT_235026 [Emiliania huxleyi CCMP1516]|uniref:Uncharacterized protein n=2 Tax=Emiliania huxleyi TaxID=2903 RepID=A0A0D3JXK6_EMIH1|nr:hypothetical protein EMIHUDRAFT_235026 [Emiliania huxleyi CCMP1516]EOD28241.1 hypothetical protein EMIHUDRAFT_235026 [Emiliania huxleyi CCMP1516]|eukprot:XP_005780670.1 hypothetical protein EMIHUDRAFT_235026 [Emiliania huxleyi CCMP1516]